MNFLALIAVSMCHGQERPMPLETIKIMIEREHEASLHKPPFSYTSIEKSDRTNGHKRTEQVVEVSEGKLRYLIAKDGRLLSPERKRREISRLQLIVEDPQTFIRREHAQKDEERRAQHILDLLPKAFLLQERISRQQSSLHKDFKLLPSTPTISQTVALLIR